MKSEQAISRCFKSLKSRGQGAFIPFITAGYPGLDESKVQIGVVYLLVHLDWQFES